MMMIGLLTWMGSEQQQQQGYGGYPQQQQHPQGGYPQQGYPQQQYGQQVYYQQQPTMVVMQPGIVTVVEERPIDTVRTRHADGGRPLCRY